MRKLILATAIALSPSVGWAQCSGVFPPNSYCGNITGSPAAPTAVPGTAAIAGPGSSTVGDIGVWNNTTGSLLKDVPPLQIYGTIGNNLFLAGPTTGGPLNPTFRAITSSDLASISGPTNQNLTSGSGATYTTPAGVKWIEVFMVGGGAGGSGAGAAIVAGTGGGTSTFNSINAAGGSAGASTGAPGAGGTGGTGTAIRRAPGGAGGVGSYNFNQTTTDAGGGGGVSYFGGGGASPVATTTAAGVAAAANTGAGGSGAVSHTGATQGGGGGAGEFVYLIISNPAATYTYTVGTSGGGGVGSTVTGGAGGTGFIFVVEHYAP